MTEPCYCSCHRVHATKCSSCSCRENSLQRRRDSMEEYGEELLHDVETLIELFDDDQHLSRPKEFDAVMESLRHDVDHIRTFRSRR